MTEQVCSRMARDGRAANVEAYEAMKKLAPGLIAEFGTRKAASPAHCVGFPRFDIMAHGRAVFISCPRSIMHSIYTVSIYSIYACRSEVCQMYELTQNAHNNQS